MSLETAGSAMGSMGTLPTAVITATVTAGAGATAAATNNAATAAQVPGEAGSTPEHATTSSTVMIVIGCIIGILGVAGVITLIWWMRKRALAQQTYMPTDLPQYNAPKPPPKGGPILATQKSLPDINASPATRPARSTTVGSADKDKALPIKPAESVWSPTQSTHPKSPAFASVHEMTAQKGRTEDEKNQARERSTSVGSYKAPQNFI